MDEDEIALRIEAFDEANGGGVGWYEDKGAYHLYLLATEAPIGVPVTFSSKVAVVGMAENSYF